MPQDSLKQGVCAAQQGAGRCCRTADVLPEAGAVPPRLVSNTGHSNVVGTPWASSPTHEGVSDGAGPSAQRGGGHGTAQSNHGSPGRKPW